MSEQIIDLLEPVEIKTEYREALARAQRLDLLVDPGIEMAAVGKRGEGIVMRQKIDVLLGVLARLQIANGDDVMRSSAKNDGPQDRLDRGHRAVEMAQIRLHRQVRSGKQRSSLAPARWAVDKPVNSAKLVLTETITSPSQTRSPSTEALARSRIRSTSSPERRRSQIPSKPPASASPMMPKLAIATPTASHSAGTADCETSIVG